MVKKILMISHDGSFSGAPLFLERLALKLANSHYRVVIFCAGDGPVLERMRLDGFEVYHSNKRPQQRGRFRSLFYRVMHYWRFLVILRLVRPDIIYSNTIVNCGEVLLGRACGFKTLIHMHEGMSFARPLKRRLALQVAMCNEILVGSEYAGKVLYTLTGKHGRVVPIGISEDPIGSLLVPTDNALIRVGILGSLCENKGQMLALEAVSMLIARGVSVQLIVGGAEADIDYANRLKNFAAKSEFESDVLFLGQMDSVDTFFRSIDILIVCSYDEVFPTVILEGMREMKLVVATRVGGIPEIIEDGVTGLLYEPGDSKELAECVLQLAGNRDGFSKITQNARDRFVSHYGMDVVVAAILDRFELVGRH